jgi:PilZ domain
VKWGNAAQELWSTSAAKEGADQRAQDRFKLWGTLAFCRFELGPEERDHLAVVEDASPSGLYIAIQLAPPVGTLLQLQIYSQAGKRGSSVVRARAKVRWCRSLHEPTGLGVEIVDFSDGEWGQANWLALLRGQGDVSFIA